MTPLPTDQPPTAASIERELSSLTGAVLEVSGAEGDTGGPSPSSRKPPSAPFEAPAASERPETKQATSEAPPTTVDAGFRGFRDAVVRDDGPSSEAFSGPETPRVDIPPVALEALRAWLVPSPEGPRLVPWSRSRPQGAVEVIVVATQAGAHLRALLS